MDSLEADLERARALDVDALADAVEAIGFECTRCGGCCTAVETPEAREDHTATVFPDEVRRLRDAGEEEYDWRDVARPMPYGLAEGDAGPEGETFEWALQTDDCGDCVFYEEPEEGQGACTVHPDRPLICRTYPFSVVLTGAGADGEDREVLQPMGEAVDREGPVRAHECSGLGRDTSRADAEAMARTLKERAVREMAEALAVRKAYRPVEADPGTVVVHDSEGAKGPDGTPISDR